MTYTNLIKTGLGLGLLAVSLGVGSTAMDGKHSFGSASIYVRSSNTGTNYTSFIPSGNQSTDSVIVVEHLQGTAATTPMTWSYMVPVTTLGGLSGAAASAYIPTGSLIGSIFSPSSSTWAIQSGSVTTSTVSMDSFRYDKMGMGWISSTTISIGSTTMTNPVWDIYSPIAYPFSYSTSVSSSQCNVTAVAVIDNNDYLQWGGIVAQAVGYASASSPGAAATDRNVSVVWVSGTKSTSGTSGAGSSSYTTYTASNYISTFGSAAWNAMQTATSASISFPTNATILIPGAGQTTTAGFTMPYNTGSTAAALSWGTVSGGASSPAQSTTFASGASIFTMPASQYKAVAACGNAYIARASLNTTNLLIGGRSGLMRLW